MHSLELLRLRLPCDALAPQDARQAAALVPEAVVIAVTDVARSETAPSAKDREVGAGGLGLRLIGSLARRWGPEHATGRRVWAELELAA